MIRPFRTALHVLSLFASPFPYSPFARQPGGARRETGLPWRFWTIRQKRGGAGPRCHRALFSSSARRATRRGMVDTLLAHYLMLAPINLEALTPKLILASIRIPAVL